MTVPAHRQAPTCADRRAPVRQTRVAMLLACATASFCGTSFADGYYFSGYWYQVFGTAGDPSYELVQIEGDGVTIDGVTARRFDTGRRVSGLDPEAIFCTTDPVTHPPRGFAHAAGAVDLASATMAISARTGGAWNHSAAGARLVDTLTFHLPDGMTETTVGASLTVVGAYTSPTSGGDHMYGYVQIYLGGWAADNSGNTAPGMFVGQTYSVEAVVQDSVEYQLSATINGHLQSVTDWCAGEQGSYSLSGYVVLDVPDGVTYTSASGILLSASDDDLDGNSAATDNCTLVANIGQIDADADGFGNACDADYNNDCIVNVLDLGILRAGFFSADPVVDLNGDGVVNVVDLGMLRTRFFHPPGPSATGCTSGT